MNAQIAITEAEIANMVDRFYAKVRVDRRSVPYSTMRSITGDAHLALLTDFWSTVLRATGRYKGNLLLAHFPLPIEEDISPAG
jgi:hemoglobin